MKCDYCGFEKLKATKNGLLCEKCGQLQKPKKKHYTYPLEDSFGQYAKKR